jgi:hypothetical protein
MPERLDSNGIPAIIHRTLQALGAGHISARRAAVLLYGIQMSSAQAPQIRRETEREGPTLVAP